MYIPNTLFDETERTRTFQPAWANDHSWLGHDNLGVALLTALVESFQAMPAKKHTNAIGVLPTRPGMTERHNNSSDSEKTINLRCQPRNLFSAISIVNCLHMKPMNE